jgi:MSHA biogenesis protein MshP
MRQRGLGAIAAIVVLVLLAILAATVVRISWSSHGSNAQAVLGARASQGVRAGIEWGLFQVLQGSWKACSGSPSQTLDLRTELGVRVTVRCTVNSYQEGADSDGAAQTVRIYRIESIACNGSAATCPDNTAAATAQYVERLRVSTAADCITVGGTDCL